jgi:hypothetical protein
MGLDVWADVWADVSTRSFLFLNELLCNGFRLAVTTIALPLFRQPGILAEQAGAGEWRIRLKGLS